MEGLCPDKRRGRDKREIQKYFSLESAVLQCGQLVDAALMAAAFKLGVQEEIHQLAGKAGADHAAAHAQSIGVVVAAVYSQLKLSEQQQARMP